MATQRGSPGGCGLCGRVSTALTPLDAAPQMGAAPQTLTDGPSDLQRGAVVADPGAVRQLFQVSSYGSRGVGTGLASVTRR
ncbi:hypothetical protein GCM10027074_33360 [Streptomyces deserti]